MHIRFPPSLCFIEVGNKHVLEHFNWIAWSVFLRLEVFSVLEHFFFKFSNPLSLCVPLFSSLFSLSCKPIECSSFPHQEPIGFSVKSYLGLAMGQHLPWHPKASSWFTKSREQWLQHTQLGLQFPLPPPLPALRHLLQASTPPSNCRTIPKQTHILLTLLYRSPARIKNILTTPGGGRGGYFPIYPSWVCSFISTVPQNKTHFIFFYL